MPTLDPELSAGQRRTFRHAFHGQSDLTDYEAHHGQQVTILRAATPEDGFDDECLPQWIFRAADGWEGHGDPEELTAD